MVLLVDHGIVLSSSANELQKNYNASSEEKYISRILIVFSRFLAFIFDLCDCLLFFYRS